MRTGAPREAPGLTDQAESDRAAQDLLRRIFGHASFRPQQLEAIRCLHAGRDALVLMPTGGGKSVCYQIPAMLKPGCAVVVSPLIALMEDQVGALRQLGVRADFLNSSLFPDQRRRIEAAAVAGQIDLLYIAPERLLSEAGLALLDRLSITLFAIDEAHCLSRWGHDFRPDYLRLATLRGRFPRVPCVALTATADERTREEILEVLDMGGAGRFITDFNRPNICYHLLAGGGNAREQLWRFISTYSGEDAGIVYCLTRAKVEETAAWLSDRGRPALPYHAGLDPELRRTTQRRFQNETGVIVVATIAFGMGIDKPDVRFVAHLGIPKSIEAYYQETGRAGRDGYPAQAWLCYGLQEVIQFRRWIEESDLRNERKRIERQKLEAMLGLCESGTCRRRVLLTYFGQVYEADCGNCDNCLAPPHTEDGTLDAQKALSCIYRTGQRFGVAYLIKVLLGRQDERLLRFRHHRLKTFGVGADRPETHWRSVYRQLIAGGLAAVDGEHGGLRLTEQSRQVLKGRRWELRVPARPSGKQRKRKPATPGGAAREDLRPDEQERFERLRVCRLGIAKKLGVPPYVIFPDRTLIEMLRTHPQSLEELGQISGVGASRLARYGPTFLRLLREGIN